MSLRLSPPPESEGGAVSHPQLHIHKRSRTLHIPAVLKIAPSPMVANSLPPEFVPDLSSHSQLPEEEAEAIGLVLDLLADRRAARVARFRVVLQQHWPIGTCSRLDECRHLACVQRRDPRVAVTGDEEDRRKVGPRHHVVIR